MPAPKSARGGRKTVKSDNVKVFCRFRPQNQLERKKTGNGAPVVEFQGLQTVLVKPEGAKLLKKKNKKAKTARSKNEYDDNRFTFDCVFSMRASQAEVYEQAAAPMAEKLLQGYNCTVFAYGQTGSGKTHTMVGYSEAGMAKSGTNKNDVSLAETTDDEEDSELDSMYTDDEDEEEKSTSKSSEKSNGPKVLRWSRAEEMGIIPRLVQNVFEEIKTQEAGIEFTVTVSYIEIYLEKVRDLLKPENDNLAIRETREKGVYIDGVKEKTVASWEEVRKLMEKGENNRQVSSTKMNAQSSRSHSCLILRVDQRDQQTYGHTASKLTLVDLAGSEKVRKTGAEGLTLLQAQHTNKSLSALGGVIRSLTEQSSHIPYRDSKLTRLLQDSLGGNSMTSMVICGSPSAYNLEETLSTLRFGRMSKLIKNKPKLNVEKSVQEYKALLASAQKKSKQQSIALSALRDVVDESEQIFKENNLQPPDVPDPEDVPDKVLAETEGMQLLDLTLSRSFAVKYQEQVTNLETRIADVTEGIQKLQDANIEKDAELHKLNQEVVMFRARFTKSRLRKAQEEADSMRDKVKNLETTIDDLRNEVKTSRQTINQLEDERQHLSKSSSGLQSKVADMESSIQEKSEQILKLTDERDNLDDSLKDSLNRIERLESELDEYRSNLESVKGKQKKAEGQAEVRIKSLEQQLSQLEKTLKEKTEKLHTATRQASEQDQKIENLKRSLAEQNGALQNMESSSKSTHTRVVDLENQNSELQTKINDMKVKMSQLEQNLKKKDDEMNELKNTNEELRERLENAPQTNQSSGSNIMVNIEMQEELEDLQAQLEEALAENIRLEDDLIDTRADAYDQLMELEETEKNLAEERQLHEETRLQLRKFLKKAELWEYIEAGIPDGARLFRAVDNEGKASIELRVKAGKYGWMALSRDLERQVRQWLKMARKHDRRRQQ